MRKFLTNFIIGTSIVFGANSAFANDSVAVMGAGGLEFAYSNAIEMVSEDLYISLEEIKVDYVFRNNSDKDITTIVAFPMPDIRGNPYGDISIPFPDSDNFMGFSVNVNGEEIIPNLEQKAFALGLDVSEILYFADIPFLPYGRKTMDKLAQIYQSGAKGVALIEDLKKRAMVEVEDFGESAMGGNPIPIWTLKSTYWWEMVFPANETIKVSHKYVPAVGGTGLVSFMDNMGNPTGSYDEFLEKYCMDAPFLNAVKREILKGENFYETYISYILTTAQNWYGMIGTFRLRVDKGSTGNFVSFCGENLTKIAPTIFEFVANDYVPEKDLEVLIVRRLE